MLEVKLVETEMDLRKKTNELNTKLRHQEEEFRQKDSATEKEIRSLKRDVLRREAVEKEQMKLWESKEAQMSTDSESAISVLNSDLNQISTERDELKEQVLELTDLVQSLRKAKTSLEEDVNRLNADAGDFVSVLSDKDASIKSLSNQIELEKKHLRDAEEEICSLNDEVEKLNSIICDKDQTATEKSNQAEDEKARCGEAVEKVGLLERQLDMERSKSQETEKKLQELKSEIESKVTGMDLVVAEKESEYKAQLNSYKGEIDLKEKQVLDLEDKLRRETEHVQKLRSDRDQIMCELSESKAVFTEAAVKLKNSSDDLLSKLERESSNKLHAMSNKLQTAHERLVNLSHLIRDMRLTSQEEMEREKTNMLNEFDRKMTSLMEEHDSKECEWKTRVAFLDNQLQQEVLVKEEQQLVQSTCKKESDEKETSMKSRIDSLQQELETHKRELINKLSELESKNKEFCELSLKLTDTRHAYKALQNEYDHSKETFSDVESMLKVQISDRTEKLDQSQKKNSSLSEEIDSLKKSLSEKETFVAKLTEDKDIIFKEKNEEIKLLTNSVSEKEMVVAKLTENKDLIFKEKNTEIELLKASLDEKEKIVNCLTQDKDLIFKEKQEESQRCLTERSCKEKLESQLNTTTKTLEEMTQEHTNHVSQITTLKSEKEALNSQLNESNALLQAVIQERDEKDALLKEADEKYTHIYEEMKTQVQKEKETEALINRQEQTVAAQLSEIEEMQVLLGSKDTELEKLLSDCQKSESQYLSQVSEYQTNLEQLETAIRDKDQIIADKDNSYHQIYSELEDLNSRLKDRDQKIEDAGVQVAEMTSQLKQMENRYRELETKCAKMDLTLQERYATSEESNKVLATKEIKCKEMEEQLEKTEKDVEALREQLSTGSKDSQILVQSLESKETDLKEVRAQVDALKGDLDAKEEENSSLNALLMETKEEREYFEHQFEVEKEKACTTENCLLETEKECQSLQEKLKDLEKSITEMAEERSKINDDMKSLQSSQEQKETRIQILSRSLEEYDADHQEKNARINHLESELNERERIITTEQNELMKHLRERLEQTTAEAELLQDRLEEAGEKIGEMDSEKAEMESNFQTLLNELDEYKVRLDQATLERKNNEVNYQEKQKVYSDTLTKLKEIEAAHAESQCKVAALKEEVAQLERGLGTSSEEANEMQEVNEKLNADVVNKDERIRSLDSQVDDLTACVALKENENQSLKTTIGELKKEVAVWMDEKSSDRDAFQRQQKELELLREEKNMLGRENRQLQKELDNAATEFDGLHASCEEGKANIERQMDAMELEKQQLQENFRRQSIALDDMTHKVALLECRREEQVVPSSAQLHRSELTGAVSVEEQMIEEKKLPEECIKASAATTLSSLQSKSKQGRLSMTRKDSEKSVEEQETGDKEMARRVHELEEIEKELREQIVDIEMTVIVPLETENQELKDEIVTVRQERDEAISKISLWDDEDDGDGRMAMVEAVESAHQRLEEALVQTEELEKKNEILLLDIAMLEAERENSVKAVADLESAAVEKDEKLECLQERVERLSAAEQKVLVLEESETRLMDRVLDLEEREQNLTQELVDEKRLSSVRDEQKSQAITIELETRLKYLTDKNQILQDAEGHYMERVMELEELVERLKSEQKPSHNLSHDLVSPSDVSLCVDDHAHLSAKKTDGGDEEDVVAVSNASLMSQFVSLSTQTSSPHVPLYEQRNSSLGSSVNVGATDDIVDSSVISVVSSSFDANVSSATSSSLLSSPLQENANFLPSPHQTPSSTAAVSLKEDGLEAERQFSEAKLSKEELLSESKEKDDRIYYLEDKIDLLRDSEAGLMEKLLEADENLTQMKANVEIQINELAAKVKILSDENERLREDVSKTTAVLRAKIDVLQEENDFLAGNVENYQTLYKEEKEKSDDLQDRVIDDSSRLSRAQEELAETQKMVQEIQSEYEEQLSDRLRDEAKLKKELSAINAR